MTEEQGKEIAERLNDQESKPPVIEGVSKPPVIEGVDEFKKKKASTAVVVASTAGGIMVLFVIAIIIFIVLCAIAFLWVLYNWKWPGMP